MFIGFFQIIFIFITLIKTDVLTVDTSSIINSLPQIIDSINNLNFTACWIRTDIQVILIVNFDYEFVKILF